MKIIKTYIKKERIKLNPELEPRIRARQQTPGGMICYEYVHSVFDITTGKRLNRGYSFGRFRPKKEAYRLIMKWRKNAVKQINKKARDMGLR